MAVKKKQVAEKKPQYAVLLVNNGRMHPALVGRTTEFSEIKKKAYYAVKDRRADQVIVVKVIGQYTDKNKAPKVVWEEISPKKKNGGLRPD